MASKPPWLLESLLSWACAYLLVAWTWGRRPAPTGSRYDPATQRIAVPGSWQPLAVLMAIFACNFFMGTLKAVAPGILKTLPAAMVFSALFGVFTGLLDGRVLQLLKLPKQHDHQHPLKVTS